MAMPMRSTDFRSIVEPILNKEFDGIYDQRKDEWKGFMREFTGIPRSYHEEPVLYGFGAAPELPDGTAVTYKSGGQLYSAIYNYKVWGLAFALTKVLVEDGDHIRIGQTYSRHLAQSLIETKETLCANILNRAFNSSYTGGDGVSLISTSHPTAVGTSSNQLTTAAALSQTSLEQMLIQIRNATDANGKRIRLNPEKIVCGPSLVFQAEVLLKSALRTGTANNDINPINSMGMLSGGQANVSRVTSTTAWWVKTDVPEGLKLAMRRGLEKSMEGDFDTDSMRYKATERYIPNWTDWRDLWGTAGV
ncbi:Bacteriophage Mu, GpT [uncultured Caudovirales phage]|uniref:Bacteriophage Mu, GpT n=1 Tax=uncultured Caudovirales phage TaxID=2100421 RepID=A0A6J5MHH6_9CAUD|nr:Bacteriophage Mu, GpT [uncultured Caudovirales phage]CAB4176324.1 Bacteriophage Mu, GpT [uncultured Caudovirales phage]CAB4189496.1 Bacteriophage Mu, GpT [uncultured Caudovirales phage]